MEKKIKEMLKDEIVRLRSEGKYTHPSIIVSREDFRLLAKEISEYEKDFGDVIIVVDDAKVLASKNMPFRKDIRFEPIHKY